MCHICFARRRPYAGKFFEIHHREKVGRLLILFKLQMILVQKRYKTSYCCCSEVLSQKLRLIFIYFRFLKSFTTVLSSAYTYTLQSLLKI